MLKEVETIHLHGSGESGGGSTSTGIFIGYINENTPHLPSTRPDGQALQNEDYIKVDGNAEVPFIIDNIEINSKKDKLLYFNGDWFLDAGTLQTTAETPTDNKTQESITGTADTQAKINIENVKNTKQLIFNFETAQKEWNISHLLNKYPKVKTIDNTGNEFYGTIVYPTLNNVKIIFNKAVSGKAIVN